MLSTNRIRSRGFMVFISFSALFLACNPGEPLNPAAEDFRKQMLTDYRLLSSVLVPALETDEPIVAAGEAIDNFLLEPKSKDQGIFGISLLDISGKYSTGAVIDSKDTGKLIKDIYKDTNFHSYRVVEQIVKSRRVMQERLYLQNNSILAIGFPVINNGDLMGILCFSFESHEFEKKWGLSEKEFLRIDFGEM